MRLLRLITCAFVLLAVAAPPVAAAVDATGTWYGVLRTPHAMELTLVVTLSRNDDGTFKGELESVDQAPGQKIPLTSVTVTADHLTFTIKPLGASYEGDWVEAGAHWSGTFTQGLALPFSLTRGTLPPRATVDGLDGLWEGAVVRNGVNLRLILRVTTGDRGTMVTLDSPDLGALGVAVAGFARRGDTVAFTVPASGVQFSGTLTGDDTLGGIWKLPGQPDAKVTFTRTRATAARQPRARPQMPKPPFDYDVEDVSVPNLAADGVTLAGTLTRPRGTGPFPAAVLITGSGPQDRDETLMGHKPFAVLADYLTRHGVAVLRYDDRGVGRSTGVFTAATSADFATDANAAVRYLLTRSEVDPHAVGLIGHSEGGMIAPIAAVDNGKVAFVVMLAGPGTNLIQLMQSQRRLMGLSAGVSEEQLTRTEPVMAEMFAAVAASSSTGDARDRARAVLTPAALETLGVPESQREVQKDLIVRQISSAWYRYFLRYDPGAVLARVTVPVLALNGSLDRQVPAGENLPAIRAALAHNPDVTIRKIDGLNHLFQTAKTGAIGEYADSTETMAPEVLGIVAEWIGHRFGPSHARSLLR